VKNHASFKWKDAISGFHVSPGSAEALVRCGGKIKYILIAYFLSNIYAKSCRNRTVYVKIIASCKGGTFFLRHSVLLFNSHVSMCTWISHFPLSSVSCSATETLELVEQGVLKPARPSRYQTMKCHSIEGEKAWILSSGLVSSFLHPPPDSWWKGRCSLRGPAVEHWSLADVLSLSCAWLVADGWPLMWVSHPL